MRELLRLHLANAGYEVAMAEDGVVGGKLLLQQQPDLLVVDVQMPYLNGIDLVSAIRAEPGLRDLPVVIISSRETFEASALILGAEYLVKPFTKDKLLRTIAAALPERADAAAAPTFQPSLFEAHAS